MHLRWSSTYLSPRPAFDLKARYDVMLEETFFRILIQLSHYQDDSQYA